MKGREKHLLKHKQSLTQIIITQIVLRRELKSKKQFVSTNAFLFPVDFWNSFITKNDRRSPESSRFCLTPLTAPAATTTGCRLSTQKLLECVSAAVVVSDDGLTTQNRDFKKCACRSLSLVKSAKSDDFLQT